MATLRTLGGLLLASIMTASGASNLFAQARSDVYFTGPDNVISRVTSFADGESVTVVDENGTNLRGLVAGTTAPAS
jgi:hypothetical protein